MLHSNSERGKNKVVPKYLTGAIFLKEILNKCADFVIRNLVIAKCHFHTANFRGSLKHSAQRRWRKEESNTV